MATFNSSMGRATQIENGRWIAIWDGSTVTDADSELIEFATEVEAKAYLSKQAADDQDESAPHSR